LDTLCDELDEHLNNLTHDGARAAEKQYHKDKENYLRHEVICDFFNSQS